MTPSSFICSHCFEPIITEESYSVIPNGPIFCTYAHLIREAEHIGAVEAKLILEDASDALAGDRDWLGTDDIEAAWTIQRAIAYVEGQIPEYLRVRE